MKINYVVFVLHTKKTEYVTVPAVKEKIPTPEKKKEVGKRKQKLQPKLYRVVKAAKKKKKDVIDLRKFVKSNFTKNLPNFPSIGAQINEVLLCSSNGRCEAQTGKKQKKYKKDYVLKQIKDGKIIDKNTEKDPVLCRIKGKTKDNNGFEIRIPTTGNIKVTLGLSNHKNVVKNNETLVNTIDKFVKKVILSQKELPELKEPEIVNMVITGAKLWDGTLRKFQPFHQEIAKRLEKQGYEYEPPMDRNRKQFHKISIRSTDQRFPTIGIFKNGKVHFAGVTNLKWVYKVLDVMQKAVKDMNLNLVNRSVMIST